MVALSPDKPLLLYIAILMSCYDIECIRLSTIKGQVVADLLANFLGTSDFSLPQREVLAIEEQE